MARRLGLINRRRSALSNCDVLACLEPRPLAPRIIYPSFHASAAGGPWHDKENPQFKRLRLGAPLALRGFPAPHGRASRCPWRCEVFLHPVCRTWAHAWRYDVFPSSHQVGAGRTWHSEVLNSGYLPREGAPASDPALWSRTARTTPDEQQNPGRMGTCSPGWPVYGMDAEPPSSPAPVRLSRMRHCRNMAHLGRYSLVPESSWCWPGGDAHNIGLLLVASWIEHWPASQEMQ